LTGKSLSWHIIPAYSIGIELQLLPPPYTPSMMDSNISRLRKKLLKLFPFSKLLKVFFSIYFVNIHVSIFFLSLCLCNNVYILFLHFVIRFFVSFSFPFFFIFSTQNIFLLNIHQVMTNEENMVFKNSYWHTIQP
jgi:hypothetical protein